MQKLVTDMAADEDQTNDPETGRRNKVEVAVIVPCYNEAQSIATVVRDFHVHLPGARVYVYDNNSTDRTTEVAKAAGALVRFEPIKGKGNVVRRMFADVEADVYVLVDGDGTYDAAVAARAVQELMSRSLDMVNIARTTDMGPSYRPGHRFGNRALTGMVGLIFGRQFNDMLSGYKVFSRRFVKSFPALAQGFEIETELTIHAVECRMPVTEIEGPYGVRPEGSTSKLRTVRDGAAIFSTILVLLRTERPLFFFSSIALALASTSLALAWPLFLTYLKTGLVPRMPTAFLCADLMVLAFLSLTCALILDTVTRGRREMRRLYYLSLPGPAAAAASRPVTRPTEPSRRSARSLPRNPTLRRTVSTARKAGPASPKPPNS